MKVLLSVLNQQVLTYIADLVHSQKYNSVGRCGTCHSSTRLGQCWMARDGTELNIVLVLFG